MSNTANTATEVVAEVAEEVAEQATQLAQASRGTSGRDISLVFGGFIVGAGLSGMLGYIFAKKHLDTKYSQIAAEEIAEMRQHYANKAVALESEATKPALEELVRERGYIPDEPEESTQPPMAVSAPPAVVEAAQEATDEPVKVFVEEEVSEVPETRNVFEDNAVDDEWDYAKERARRSPLEPYVIHREECDEQNAYDSVTFTYYEDDDVLCNEADDVIQAPMREKLVGEENLTKFGHGSLDANVVYIRNDQLETDFEVIRSPNSYAEEVHGFTDDDPSLQHANVSRRRGSFDDD